MRLKNRSDLSIAHGALTNSKRTSCFVEGVYPTHIKKGNGCYLSDEDGKNYIDYICSLGVNIFGYNNTNINEAIKKQLLKGTIFSLGSDLEVIVAERFKQVFTFINKLRFLKTGSEACSAAIRIARAYNGKNMILSEGYHGWHDEFVSLTPPANGIPEFKSVWISELNSSRARHVDLAKVSAIIVEPVIIDNSEKRIERLKQLRKLCDDNNIVLIFDETITGYRFPKLSVSQHYNIIPDLIILGKGIGGGLPLSIVGGKKEIMESDYFVSSTFAGDNIALAAALEASLMIKTSYRVEGTWANGGNFKRKFNEICKGLLRIEGYPTRGVFKGKSELLALFFQEMCLAGVLLGPSWFYNKHLIQENENVLDITKNVIKKIKDNKAVLKGSLPIKPYSQKVRS